MSPKGNVAFQKWRRLLELDPLKAFFGKFYIKRDLVVVALGRLSMCEGCNPFWKRDNN
jgi:hypothetical protein